ncbi:molybdopterin cofactor-binding domain-containing protein [Streptomyces sp. NPDC004752]
MVGRGSLAYDQDQPPPLLQMDVGSGLRTWPHVTVAALAARETGRPAKVVLSRGQQYFGTGFRPAYKYQVQLGSDSNGRVSAMTRVNGADMASTTVRRGWGRRPGPTSLLPSAR